MMSATEFQRRPHERAWREGMTIGAFDAPDKACRAVPAVYILSRFDPGAA